MVQYPRNSPYAMELLEAQRLRQPPARTDAPWPNSRRNRSILPVRSSIEVLYTTCSLIELRSFCNQRNIVISGFEPRGGCDPCSGSSRRVGHVQPLPQISDLPRLLRAVPGTQVRIQAVAAKVRTPILERHNRPVYGEGLLRAACDREGLLLASI